MCHLPDLPPSSADIITAAQALHWLDLDACFKEVKRLLVPNGVFAVLGYGICSLVKQENAEKIFKDYYYNVLGSALPVGADGNSWAIDRRAVDSGLEGYPFASAFASVEREWFYEVKQMSVQAFIGYLRTFSGYHAYMKKNQGQVDPLVHVEKEILASVGGNALTVSIPYWAIFCRP